MKTKLKQLHKCENSNYEREHKNASEITHSTLPSVTVSHVECLPNGVEVLDVFGSSTATSYLPADKGQRRCLSYNNNSALYAVISSEDFIWFLSRRVPSRSLDRVTRSSELRRNLLRGGGSWFSITTAPWSAIQAHSFVYNNRRHLLHQKNTK